jgi:hypothetical protein
MQGVLKDARPNCIVLDEIDGANKGAINALIRIIQAGGKLLTCFDWPILVSLLSLLSPLIIMSL